MINYNNRIFKLLFSVNIMIQKKISINKIIKYYMRTSKGIKATAGYFGLSKSYVGCVINKYKKANNIR